MSDDDELLSEEEELSLLELEDELSLDEDKSDDEEPRLISHDAKTIMLSNARLNLNFFCIKNALSDLRLT